MTRKSDDYVRYGLVTLRAMREDAGLSQLEMANRMGISLNTVANWESGKSAPDVVEAWQWYRACGRSPVHYIMDWQDPDRFVGDSSTRELLSRALELLPEETIDVLLYIISGNHGSDPEGLIALLGAHVHLPLKARLTHATMVQMHYEVARDIGTLTHLDRPMPDLDILSRCIEQGHKAVRRNEESYHFENE